eukprot:398081-Pyramimonas_sp.AAC.1
MVVLMMLMLTAKPYSNCSMNAFKSRWTYDGDDDCDDDGDDDSADEHDDDDGDHEGDDDDHDYRTMLTFLDMVLMRMRIFVLTMRRTMLMTLVPS